MQIVEKKVTELKAYEKNPRKNDKAVGQYLDCLRAIKPYLLYDGTRPEVCSSNTAKIYQP